MVMTIQAMTTKLFGRRYYGDGCLLLLLLLPGSLLVRARRQDWIEFTSKLGPSLIVVVFKQTTVPIRTLKSS